MSDLYILVQLYRPREKLQCSRVYVASASHLFPLPTGHQGCTWFAKHKFPTLTARVDSYLYMCPGRAVRTPSGWRALSLASVRPAWCAETGCAALALCTPARKNHCHITLPKDASKSCVPNSPFTIPARKNHCNKILATQFLLSCPQKPDLTQEENLPFCFLVAPCC